MVEDSLVSGGLTCHWILGQLLKGWNFIGISPVGESLMYYWKADITLKSQPIIGSITYPWKPTKSLENR